MLTLLEIWNDETILKPFIVKSGGGEEMFLCRERLNNNLFYGERVETDPHDPRVFRSVQKIIVPGNLAIWELL